MGKSDLIEKNKQLVFPISVIFATKKNKRFWLEVICLRYSFLFFPPLKQISVLRKLNFPNYNELTFNCGNYIIIMNKQCFSDHGLLLVKSIIPNKNLRHAIDTNRTIKYNFQGRQLQQFRNYTK